MMTSAPSQQVVAVPETNTAVVDRDEPDSGNCRRTVLTQAERTRFQKAFPKETDCKARIEEYLVWRKEYCPTNDELDDSLNQPDHAVWRWAVKRASERQDAASTSNNVGSSLEKPGFNSRMNSNETQSTVESAASGSLTTGDDSSSLSASPSVLERLPQVVFNHRRPNDDRNDEDATSFLRDKEGHRILHILAARLDPSLADASLYATALALYLDRCMERTSLERVTLLLDVRPGKGWCNLPALELVGFTRRLVGRLQTLFPDRLHRCILFPVPHPAILLWNLFSVFLHESTRSAVCLVPGGADLKSPLPRKALQRYVDDSCANFCEDVRLAHFQAKQHK